MIVRFMRLFVRMTWILRLGCLGIRVMVIWTWMIGGMMRILRLGRLVRRGWIGRVLCRLMYIVGVKVARVMWCVRLFIGSVRVAMWLLALLLRMLRMCGVCIFSICVVAVVGRWGLRRTRS